ncbi:P-loop containing nucleoside triphosphate hydrolase protein [Crepidotus variabilis]|uniref:P-loop containing nucleoside triphosphate hydrolase protein n=1 Tax=Crepidotus variabilis TaxID=179855 RepID=A0A9P6JW06_9AGAR|nr:P-loop containing nucleoside triphosphate hydrolase protein [Crepidotus variabilis]
MTSQPQDSTLSKWLIHVEVRLKLRSSARYETIKNAVYAHVTSYETLYIPSTLEGWKDVPELADAVERIIVCESACPKSSLPVQEMAIQVHVYQPTDGDAFEEYGNNGGQQGEEDETMAATMCELPNQQYEGLWDSLIYADNVKMKLLDYIQATLILSDANIDYNLVSWNRVVLLHGPPGTGKTSLCRALAQKIAIRFSHRYSNARLLEINSHSLFSKWFSESGKLVQKLFSGITDLIEEEDGFVVVLIDEVESLTAARAGAMAGTEPSDGLRVVNALLTQLDKLKHRKNVLIMATSNLVQAIDSAFVDRADIIQFVDLPSREAIYDILRSCLCEMTSKGVVAGTDVPSLAQVRLYGLLDEPSIEDESPQDRSNSTGKRLLSLATSCQLQGMSGRALRKLPVLALARYIGVGNVVLSHTAPSHPSGLLQGAPVEVWLNGLERAVREQIEEKGKVNQEHK